MRVHRTTGAVLVGLIGLALLVAPVRAQTAENVLTRIPSRSLGFIATPNVGGMGLNLSRFVNEATGGQIPMNLLDLVKMQMGIGPGFDDSGGLAVMLLDPAMLGMPTAALVDGTWVGPPPVAVLIPGNQPQSIFAMHQPRLDGDYVVFELGMDPVYAKPLGGYTVAAMDKPVVDAVIASDTSAAVALGLPHQTMAGGNDLALYIDMERAQPLLKVGMDAMSGFVQEMGAGPMMDPSMAGVMQMYTGMLGAFSDMMAQVQATTLAVRFGPDALLVDDLISFKPGSDLGKAIVAMGPASEPLLSHLPDRPYLLALGGSWAGASEHFAALQRTLGEAMLNALVGDVMADADQARFLELATTMNRQLTGMRVFIGSPPADTGAVAMDYVMDVHNAREFRQMWPEFVKLNETFTTALMKAMSGPTQTLRYQANAATVEGVSVDVVDTEIAYPEYTHMDEDEVEEAMTRLYGEHGARMWFAPVADDRIVLTMGGGEAFLAEAIRAARQGRNLHQDRNVAAGIAMLPRRPSLVGVCSGPNAVEFIRNTVRHMTPPDELDEAMEVLNAVNVQTATPATYGLTGSNDGLYQSLAIPNGLVADIFRNIMVVQQMQMQRHMQGPDGGAGPDPFDF